MKNKKTFVIGGSVLAALIVVVLLVCTIGAKKNAASPATPETESGADAGNDISIEAPETDDPTTGERTMDLSVIPDDGNALTVPDELAPVIRKESKELDNAGEIATPITERMPADDGNGDISVNIGQPEAYNCGTAGHHCDGPETHAFILNLELEGCPYCGKNDCHSFYATDEWGNTCYTPSKCPQYDIHKDPVCYCQTCGRKCGDGCNDTCVQFVTACNCPNCGKYVEARTCHSCGN